MSSRTVAALAGVDTKTAEKYRPAASIKPARTGKDGKTYPLSAPQEPKAKANESSQPRGHVPPGVETPHLGSSAPNRDQERGQANENARADEQQSAARGARKPAIVDAAPLREPLERCPIEILTALKATTTAEALAHLTVLLQQKHSALSELKQLREEIAKLEAQRDSFLTGGALGEVLRELKVATIKQAVQAIRKLKSNVKV
ncbi:MAG TPA: hypothetical protein VGC79_26910 [Polyangiaceae bacterium]